MLCLIVARGMLVRALDRFYILPETKDQSALHASLFFLYVLLNKLLPFTYGALGACSYVMIEGNLWIWNKTFDANLIPKDKMLILIGALSGVVNTELFKPLIGSSPSLDQMINLGEAGITFLAGYSTDFLFERLNRIISAVMPRAQGKPQDWAIGKPYPGTLTQPATRLQSPVTREPENTGLPSHEFGSPRRAGTPTRQATNGRPNTRRQRK